MWRRFLISLGLMTVALAACDQQLQMAQPQGDYEVVALIAD
ncbi:hypothetical protein BH11PSE3_BH11PSE3_21860 [soil metagenome]